ncbi:ankyrin-2 [Patella vulgata]|uniref:ankyrin-2 n=1 Tax=Patella vulgata TaxID=6465 RepID=UPI0021806B38|nr:ankyrin-2 [Patella vulgata]
MENSGSKVLLTLCEDGDSDIIALGKALLKSCKDGDYDSIDSLLKRGANVEYTDSYGNTPLLIAVGNHHTNCVDVLRNNDYSPVNKEHRDKGTGPTPFMRVKIVRLLINSGCQLNKTNRCKNSALHLAVTFEHLEVVKLLVDSGIDVSLTDQKDETALHIAITLRHVAITCVLLSRQGRLDSHSVSLVDRTYGYGDSIMVDTFLQKCMEYSVSNSEIKSVQNLIQHGMPVEAWLLAHAYRNGDLVMVDTLIQAALHQNHDQTRFPTFIYFCLIHKDIERVKKYSKYASPFGALGDGRSLLDVAYRAANCDMAGILLQNGHELTFCNCLSALNWHVYRCDQTKYNIIKIKHVIKYGIAHLYRRRTQFISPQLHLENYHELDNDILFQYINILYLMYMSNLLNNHELHGRLSQLPVDFNNQVDVNSLTNIASDLVPYPSLSRDVNVVNGQLEELAFGCLRSLQRLASIPMPLVCITRNVICGSLGPPNMWVNVGLLPLPDKLKSFLRYDDILGDTDYNIARPTCAMDNPGR